MLVYISCLVMNMLVMLAARGDPEEAEVVITWEYILVV